MSAAFDLANILQTGDFGTLWATSGWSIHVGQEPSSPNTTITLYDTGGSQPHYSEEWEAPSVQGRVRGDTGAGYPVAMAKAQAIKRHFIYTGSVERSGVFYLVWVDGDVAWLKNDENNRPIFVFNLRTIRSD